MLGVPPEVNKNVYSGLSAGEECLWFEGIIMLMGMKFRIECGPKGFCNMKGEVK